MPVIRLSSAIVQTSQQYRAQINTRLTVGELAQQLAHQDSRVQVNALELARPLRMNQTLADANVTLGDRLAFFVHAPRTAAWNQQQSDDQRLRFIAGDVEIIPPQTRAVLVGRPNAEQTPDVDLRYFVAPGDLEFVSRQCLRLDFDDWAQCWTITRIGQTRVLVNDIELSGTSLRLNKEQRLRLFRASDDPRHSDARPLAEITLFVAVSADGTTAFRGDQAMVELRVGLEERAHLLNVSEQVTARQIAGGLASHYRLPLNADVSLCALRLLAPQMLLHLVDQPDDSFLYTAINVHQSESTLLLRDVHEAERFYAVVAGQDHDVKLIGCRARLDLPQPDLDVDLYETLSAFGHDPRTPQERIPYLAQLVYRVVDRRWWIRMDERSLVPMFINSTRADPEAAMELASGDMISFGPSISHYYARLMVSIRD